MRKAYTLILSLFFIASFAQDYTVDECDNESCYWAGLVPVQCDGTFTWDDPSAFDLITANGTGIAVNPGDYFAKCCKDDCEDCCTTIKYVVNDVFPEPFFDCRYSLDGGSTWIDGCGTTVDACYGDDILFQMYNISLSGVYPSWGTNMTGGSVSNTGNTSTLNYTYSASPSSCNVEVKAIFDNPNDDKCFKGNQWTINIDDGCCDCEPILSFNNDCDVVVDATSPECIAFLEVYGINVSSVDNSPDPSADITSPGVYTFSGLCVNNVDEIFVYGFDFATAGHANCCGDIMASIMCDDCQQACDCSACASCATDGIEVSCASSIVLADLDNCSVAALNECQYTLQSFWNGNLVITESPPHSSNLYVWNIPGGAQSGTAVNQWTSACGCPTLSESQTINCGGGCPSTCSPTVNVSGCNIFWTNCPAGWTCSINGDSSSPYVAPSNGNYTLTCNGPTGCTQVNVPVTVNQCGQTNCNMSVGFNFPSPTDYCFDTEGNFNLTSGGAYNVTGCSSFSCEWDPPNGPNEFGCSFTGDPADGYGTYILTVTCNDAGPCQGQTASDSFVLQDDCVVNNCDCTNTPSATFFANDCEIEIFDNCADYTWRIVECTTGNTSCSPCGASAPILTGTSSQVVPISSLNGDGVYQVQFIGSNGCSTFFECVNVMGCDCTPNPQCSFPIFQNGDETVCSGQSAFGGTTTFGIVDGCNPIVPVNWTLQLDGTTINSGNGISHVFFLPLVDPSDEGEYCYVLSCGSSMCFDLTVLESCEPQCGGSGCPNNIISPQSLSIQTLPSKITEYTKSGKSEFDESYLIEDSGLYRFEIRSHYIEDQFWINDKYIPCFQTTSAQNERLKPYVYEQFFESGETVRIRQEGCTELENSFIIKISH